MFRALYVLTGDYEVVHRDGLWSTTEMPETTEGIMLPEGESGSN